MVVSEDTVLPVTFEMASFLSMEEVDVLLPKLTNDEQFRRR
jgi:hypothetical protein